LDFNDKYQKITPAKIVNDLAGDLSVLGEHLANRIELEDELYGDNANDGLTGIDRRDMKKIVREYYG